MHNQMINNHFADIVLPLAIKGRITYSIPVGMEPMVIPGVRVLVQLGKRKLYTGIVFNLHNEEPAAGNIRPIIKVLDKRPFANEVMLKFWLWISEYYMCTPGEVIKAAVPSVFSPEGEPSLPIIEKYKPRQEIFIELASQSSEAELNEILDKLSKAPRQQEVVTAWIRLSGFPEKEKTGIRRKLLLRESGNNPGALETLVKKGILSSKLKETDRFDDPIITAEPLTTLTSSQDKAKKSIVENLRSRNIALLHGVTSSGKTEIYIHLIEEQLKQGKQVLYLLPEIGLTGQIILRLRRHFGSVTGVYHSRFNDQEKGEIWNRVAVTDNEHNLRLIIGVRSAIFLPFSNLGLIIVDEEQDSSYKQHDPAPRYNARDSAIILATFHGARTLLGSASPSVETYNNAVIGKYALVELRERFGSVRLPDIILANSREARRKKLMVSHFTPELLDTIDDALSNNEQIILFQNRRGFSPYLICSECGWIPVCVRCAVNLTYHKSIGKLICHYCGYSTPLPSRCENCHTPGLETRGFGTEKIEDEIRIVFPSARVARMDHDTTRGKKSFDKLIRAFEEHEIDILVGTQMISKGLDFGNLTVVGILNADNMLNFPDFRAHERSFQLMEQVSGRAGRRNKPGKVVIQTSNPDHKIIRLVLNHDYKNMFRLQADERKMFNYPPFSRLININVKHKNKSLLNKFSEILGRDLKANFGKRVLGPESPLISRVQLWYIKTIIVKLDVTRSIWESKKIIAEAIARLEKETGASTLRIAIDVDPY
jgi:primosomal protein N' (replication factor Y)